MASARITENTVLLLVCACMLRVLPNNGRCLQSHRLAMSLYATIHTSSFHVSVLVRHSEICFMLSFTAVKLDG
jgi:hypothetical protein